MLEYIVDEPSMMENDGELTHPPPETQHVRYLQNVRVDASYLSRSCS